MNRFWRIVNPLAMRFAGIAPWWVILETTGRKSGQPRRFPLAKGPIDGDVYWLVAVHGRRADFVRNIEASGRVRLRHKGRWRSGDAMIEAMTPEMRARASTRTRAMPNASRASTRCC
jgi:deazaflavin-dependent oxidoreductase (nitroreductase family)